VATYITAMLWRGSKTRERNPLAPATFIDPCLPTRAAAAPAGSDWAHEIKHDGYRLQIHVGDGAVRLFTISGYDWTDRYPQIDKAASRLKRSMIIDAEVVIQGPDGVTDFEALHGRSRNSEAFAYVFDLLMLDGAADLRRLPWQQRRDELEHIFKRWKAGLVLNFSIVGRGPEVYQAACRMGLEGVVSKRIDGPYRSGKSKSWLKVKNPTAPGVLRFKEAG
jgi:bifunctional non-homologous end joining protein LigD